MKAMSEELLIPKKGTLERVVVEKLAAASIAGKTGVTYLDFVGTGVTEENIDQLMQNLRTGMYEAENDHLLKGDA